MHFMHITWYGTHISHIFTLHNDNLVMFQLFVHRYRSGKIRETEVPGDAPTVLHVYHTVIPTAIEIPSGKYSMSATYIASHSNDREDALVVFEQAIRHPNDLLTSHKQVRPFSGVIHLTSSVWVIGNMSIFLSFKYFQTILYFGIVL